MGTHGTRSTTRPSTVTVTAPASPVAPNIIVTIADTTTSSSSSSDIDRDEFSPTQQRYRWDAKKTTRLIRLSHKHQVWDIPYGQTTQRWETIAEELNKHLQGTAGPKAIGTTLIHESDTCVQYTSHVKLTNSVMSILLYAGRGCQNEYTRLMKKQRDRENCLIEVR